jgi:hypothetical protein
MAVPNLGPEYDDDSADTTVRGGNAALVYRDDAATDDVRAASARASSLTHRFGGVRYALSRPSPADPEAPADTDDEPTENA